MATYPGAVTQKWVGRVSHLLVCGLAPDIDAKSRSRLNAALSERWLYMVQWRLMSEIRGVESTSYREDVQQPRHAPTKRHGVLDH